jgi:hypothetical protein
MYTRNAPLMPRFSDELQCTRRDCWSCKLFGGWDRRCSNTRQDRRTARHCGPSAEQPLCAGVLSSQRSRALSFPLNDRLSLAELERGIRASGASILLTSNAYAKTLRASWSRNEDSDQSTHV